MCAASSLTPSVATGDLNHNGRTTIVRLRGDADRKICEVEADVLAILYKEGFSRAVISPVLLIGQSAVLADIDVLGNVLYVRYEVKALAFA